MKRLHPRVPLPRHPGARVIVLLVAFFALLNVIAYVVSTVRPEPSGEAGSAYATQPRGAAAYAELLRRSGHPVTYLRDALGEARLDPATTLVLLDAPDLTGAERAALARFVRGGGRLVAGGEQAGRGVTPRPPRWSKDAPRAWRPAASAPETRNVRRVLSAGEGGFEALHGARSVLGEDPSLLATATSGSGRALLLADASPVQNRLLGEADNAALALALAGSPKSPVTFVESVHGFGQATGLAALPGHWRFALIVSLLAALLGLGARARRLGPAEQTGAEPTPARREHVDALALGLRRARDPAAALEPVRVAARAQVIRRAALAPDAPDDAVRAAALGLGFEEDEAAALLGSAAHAATGNRMPTEDVLSLGRALARGRR